MAIAYYGSQISPHMDLTPEGFLICRDVPINRIGDQQYLAHELQLDGDPERVITVHRHPEDVFAPAAMASFEAKDVTQGHPPENVTPENHALYAKGHVQNVRRNGDFTVADLVVKDASLISDIRNGVVREISCGYLCQYVPDGNGYRQTNIQGNHIAVVLKGRAGSEVSIKDAAQEAEKGRKYMSKFTEAILSAFGMAAKEAKSQEEINALVSTTATALDADPSTAAGPAAATAPVPAEPVPTGDNAPEKAPAWAVELSGKLDKVLAAQDAQKVKEERLCDETDLDGMLQKLTGGAQDPSGEKAVVIPAGKAADTDAPPTAQDAAVTILRTMRPIVAAIEDKAVRDQVASAVLSAVEDPGKMAAIDAAVKSSAKIAADQSTATSYEQRCAESQAAYAARNPHKRQEKEA